jgi:hypothetical protein
MRPPPHRPAQRQQQQQQQWRAADAAAAAEAECINAETSARTAAVMYIDTEAEAKVLLLLRTLFTLKQKHGAHGYGSKLAVMYSFCDRCMMIPTFINACVSSAIIQYTFARFRCQSKC